MDIGSLIVGLGGLLVGAFSTYLSYQDRITTFQEKIYNEQIDLIKEYFEGINPVFIQALLIPEFDSDKNLKNVQGLDSELRKATGHMEELMTGTFKDILLPDKIVQLKNELTSNLIFMTSQRSNMTIEKKKDLRDKITKNRWVLIQECRKTWGIDKLSDETLNQVSGTKIIDKFSDSSLNTVLSLIKYV